MSPPAAIAVRSRARLACALALTPAVAYAYAGLYSLQSMALIPQILPSLLIGVPIGAQLIRHIRPETFRRICMSFDAWVVAFGLSGLIRTLHLASNIVAYAEFFAVVAFDLWLLYRFFFVLPRAASPETYSRSTTTAMP